MTLAAQVLTACRARGWRIATAESCTGGMVAVALTDIPGSSDVFERGFVTYTNLAKIEVLGVAPESLDAVGAVSEQVALDMATGALEKSAADIAVSVTGIAGPGGSEFKPEGRVCFAVAQTGHSAMALTIDFGPLGRTIVRRSARDQALRMILNSASQN